MFTKIKDKLENIYSKQKTIKLTLPVELLGMKDTITKIQNSTDRFTSRLHTAKEIISKVGVKPEESIQDLAPWISHILTWSKPSEQRTCEVADGLGCCIPLVRFGVTLPPETSHSSKDKALSFLSLETFAYIQDNNPQGSFPSHPGEICLHSKVKSDLSGREFVQMCQKPSSAQSL